MGRAVGRFLAEVVAAVVLVLGSGCDPSFIVEGRVMLPDGGPVDGELVELRWRRDATTYSVVDSDFSHDRGTFRFLRVGCVPKSTQVSLASSPDASRWAPVDCHSTSFMCGSDACTQATATLVATPPPESTPSEVTAAHIAAADADKCVGTTKNPMADGINRALERLMKGSDGGVLSSRADDLKRVAKLPPCHGPHYGYFTDAGVMVGTETGPDGKTHDRRSTAKPRSRPE
jgi:hypothetical protein